MQRLLSIGVICSGVALAGCGARDEAQGPLDTFWMALSDLCGSAFEGTLTEGSENARASFGVETMVMHVRHCSETRIDVPFHVGENRSRTWVFTREVGGLRLKHDHRHEDGTEDEITQYGGDAISPGTATRQEFPADAYSIEMFAAHVEGSPGLDGAEFNLWTVDVRPGEIFAYQLTRTNDPGTRFRVEFNLSAPVDAPPPAWGHE